MQSKPQMTPPLLTLPDLKWVLNDWATIVDVRPLTDFARRHIAGTINIPFDPSFVPWASWVLNHPSPIYLIAGSDQIHRITQTLATINLPQVAGYFEFSILEDWPAQGYPLEHFREIRPDEIALQIQNRAVTLLDVRQAYEWEAGRIPHAKHISLEDLPDSMMNLPPDKPVVVQCHSGLRSCVGASILQAHGFTPVFNLKGGIQAWYAAGLPINWG